jgi:hypothetical protein
LTGTSSISLSTRQSNGRPRLDLTRFDSLTVEPSIRPRGSTRRNHSITIFLIIISAPSTVGGITNLQPGRGSSGGWLLVAPSHSMAPCYPCLESGVLNDVWRPWGAPLGCSLSLWHCSIQYHYCTSPYMDSLVLPLRRTWDMGFPSPYITIGSVLLVAKTQFAVSQS